MEPIVTPEEMAAIDAAAPEPTEVLIERAGAAVTRAALDLLGGSYGRRVVVLAGKGNNGNDGRTAARRLARRGVRVQVIDAAAAPARLPEVDLIIDAAYGTGFRGQWHAPEPATAGTPVLAVDIPTGVSGLTGAAQGDPLRAAVTVTFAALKPGLLLGDGPGLAGAVVVADIGLDVPGERPHPVRSDGVTAGIGIDNPADDPADDPAGVRTGLVTAADVRAWLPSRPVASHKWQAAVRLVAGSPGMTGAAELAATAAFRAGAGYVRRSTPGNDPASSGGAGARPIEAVVTGVPAEGWAEPVLEDLDRFGSLAVGPGLGTAASVVDALARLVQHPIPMVIDGDGLRALGDDPAAVLAGRPADAPPVVLTPHEGEFVRLGGRLDRDDAAFDRIAAVRDLAARTGAVVLLKGPTTIVAHPHGHARLSDTGDARLATAGTGDVLTGVVAAFLAEGVPPLEAAASGAWVHGRAGTLAPPIGLVAGDLAQVLPDVLAAVASGAADPAASGMMGRAPGHRNPTRGPHHG